MKKLIFAIIASSLSLSAISANSDDDKRRSFEEFRNGLFKDYADFRQTLLDNYADFLNGEWHEYQSLNGEKRYTQPKPHEAPQAPKIPARPKPQTPKPQSTRPGADKPNPGPVPTPESTTVPTPEPATQPIPTPTPQPQQDSFSFFGIDLPAPAVDLKITEKLYAASDYAAAWKQLAKGKAAETLLPQLAALAGQLNLNDYLAYQLINSFVNDKFKYADVSSRTSLLHFLLVNAGYDVRLALTEGGTPLLLIPSQQTIYARSYMMLDGKKYYLFEPDGINPSSYANQTIRTCKLPTDANLGRPFNLIITGLNIPFKAKKFTLTGADITLTGEVNENLMPILYHYPQMPTEDFARSSLMPELRASLVKQLQTQLSAADPDKAVDTLLSFMHEAFKYATDEDNHGFEKPYFLEETLFYPKNDCEDRAIFYTYFLWNALGRPAQLISYPGHESAAVILDNPIQGTSYSSKGNTYYISDPTYIGSHTGLAMPSFRNSTPTIDLTYPY